MIGKLTQRLQNPDEKSTFAKLCHWRKKLDELAQLDNNPMTAETIFNARQMADELEMALPKTTKQNTTTYEYTVENEQCDWPEDAFDGDASDADESSSSSSEDTFLLSASVSLQKSIEALSQRSQEGFYQSLPFLNKLENIDWESADSVLDKVYFHLYHIQDKETPDKIDRNDYSWGMTAFQTEALSTPDQKLRAAQRVQVEYLLNILILETKAQLDENSHAFLDGKEFVHILETLEQLNLASADLPHGQNNAAHALYGKFYQYYAKARETDPSLEDPNHEKFKGDFGRHAFQRGYVTGEMAFKGSHEIRLTSLKALAQDFRAAWHI